MSEKARKTQSQVHVAGGDDPERYKNKTELTDVTHLQEKLDLLSTDSLANYTETVTFSGANTMFRANVYRLKNGSSERRTERSDSEGVLLMLQKEECAKQVDSICDVIKDWLDRRECRVWASRTLAADLNLPMRTRPMADAIQFLLLAPGYPFVLLTVFNDTKTSSAEASTYAAQMSRLLTSSLHKFCSEDFGLLSCSIAHADFTLGKLEEEIEHRKIILQKFYGGPMLVSSTCYSAVTDAVALLASVTSVPYLLHEHDRNPGHDETKEPRLVSMDEDGLNALWGLIEVLHTHKGILDMTYNPGSETQSKAIFLEAARRLGTADQVVIVSRDETIRRSVEKLKDEASREWGVELKLAVASELIQQSILAPYIIGLDHYDSVLPRRPADGQIILKLGRKLEQSPPSVSEMPLRRSYAGQQANGRHEDHTSSSPDLASALDIGHSQIHRWTRKQGLPDTTAQALTEQNFTSVESLKLLKGQDVNSSFPDLKLADKLALKKAVDEISENLLGIDAHRLLLLGKSGSGKSSTGNTILGKDVFLTGQGLQGITNRCSLQVKTKKKGPNIEIVDSPGVFDPVGSESADSELVKAVALMDPGPTAVLYVVKLGRYTKEELDTYQKLKNLFGPGITQYMTIVFTHGDQLKKENKTIEQCIQEAGEDFGKVYEECQRRHFVLNNRDTKSNKKPAVRELLKTLENTYRVNGYRPYRCDIQQRIGEKLGDLVEEKVRSSSRLKAYQERVRRAEVDHSDILRRLWKIEDQLKTVKEDSGQKMKETICNVLKDLDRKSREVEKLRKEEENEEEKERLEQRKKLKQTIAEGKQQAWIEDTASMLSESKQAVRRPSLGGRGLTQHNKVGPTEHLTIHVASPAQRGKLVPVETDS